ncbi:conserved exported hypothetical protein [Candidatus Sulfobium mesophilum]|uniref:LysM domain-containing protein n=1 Tax=Candidatus Sulfobium mesophilum TaxID=2016548 RepID=A0A2U3QEA3_9BACT|nr:conserved exported hypothetical protein [Candidatus Sulfobium mesophilum]
MITKTALLEMTIVLVLCILIWGIPGNAGAHCDTLDGPVVTAAKIALEKGDVTPVLKWVRKNDEKEIKELFNKTLAVRKQGKEAKELADMYFFETLVRIHRVGEGAPYTGIKKEPAEPVILAADKALESGSADSLIKLVADAAAKGIRERFEHTKEAKKSAEESVGVGREFVAAYVEFTHYVERLHSDALSPSAHSKAQEGKNEQHHHH